MSAAALAAALAASWYASAAASDHPVSELVGSWRGTSTCTDRVAAPACKDEVIVYEFSAGTEAGTVHWKPDKIVDGKRQPMGDMDLTYDDGDACWRGEFRNPRVHIVWCLKPNGDQLTGSAWLIPGKENVRKVDAHREPPSKNPRDGATASPGAPP